MNADYIRKYDIPIPGRAPHGAPVGIRRAFQRENIGDLRSLLEGVNESVGIDASVPQQTLIIQLMELDEDLPAYDESATPDDNGVMPWDGKKATPLYWDAAGKKFARIESQQKLNVCNPYELRHYHYHDRVPLLYLPQAVKWVPTRYGEESTGVVIANPSQMTIPSDGSAAHIKWELGAYGAYGPDGTSIDDNGDIVLSPSWSGTLLKAHFNLVTYGPWASGEGPWHGLVMFGRYSGSSSGSGALSSIIASAQTNFYPGGSSGNVGYHVLSGFEIFIPVGDGETLSYGIMQLKGSTNPSITPIGLTSGVCYIEPVV